MPTPLRPSPADRRHLGPTGGDGRASAVLDALADPTRRRLLEAVAHDGPVTATDLAAETPISRQAVRKHLGVLEAAGIVQVERVGREARFSVVPGALDGAVEWMAGVGAAWDDRLRRLRRHLAEGRPVEGRLVDGGGGDG